MVPRWGQVFVAALPSRFEVLLVDHAVVVAIAFSQEVLPALFLEAVTLFLEAVTFFLEAVTFFLEAVTLFGEESQSGPTRGHTEGAVGIECHGNFPFAVRSGLGNPGTMERIVFVVCRLREGGQGKEGYQQRHHSYSIMHLLPPALVTVLLWDRQSGQKCDDYRRRQSSARL